MSLELVNTCATVFTALVVAATAAAALVQLRHLRSSNQISLVLKFYEELQSPEMTEAYRFVHDKLPELLADPAIRDRVGKGPVPKELYPAQRLGNLWG